jgi:hypothetical protein
MNHINILVTILLVGFNLGCDRDDTPSEEEPLFTGSDAYFVAPDGDDANPGSLELPWATWTKALSTADVGDTVYYRGGVYRDLGTQKIVGGNPHSGTKEHPICHFNYPGEEPILDNGGLIPSGGWNTGVSVLYVNHVHFRGLTIRNCHECDESIDLYGFNLAYCNDILLERITTYNNGGPGFGIFECDTIYLINCDAYSNIDTFNTSAGSGGTADGFQFWNCPGESYFYVNGCRAWGNSDDGYDTNIDGLVVFDNCWSIDNGRLEGSAAGFKWGLMETESTGLNRIIIHCLSAYNRGVGYNENNRNKYLTSSHAYNNTSYANKAGFGNFKEYNGGDKEVVYQNNIAYKNSLGNQFYRDVQESYNSWNLAGLTISDDDFVSVDSTGLTGPRQADGSLPDLDFLKLAAGSDLVDAGTDVGLPYLGGAPDLGYSEKE